MTSLDTHDDIDDLGYAPGSLVNARGRDWLVLPGSTSVAIIARPVGGVDAETGMLLPRVEIVKPSSFQPPTLADRGDSASASLLRDALRLSFRHAAGPFRSFGSLAVSPRNYQLIPLQMAVSLDPVRLLIADGVGIGKTIEAGLIAAELLACGDAERLVVLCSPQLAVQWQAELRTKFGMSAELLLPSTATRLRRGVVGDRSLFEYYPYLVVSTDYVKQKSRRDEFALYCGDLVIVDEAHSTVGVTNQSSTSIERYRLVRALADRPDRHMILLTATPHSGDHGQWTNLIGLLRDEFGDYPESLSGDANRGLRERLARHFIQRDRSTISSFLSEETPFPTRISGEATYKATGEYEALINEVIDFGRQQVLASGDATGASRQRQRVRWWQLLGLLRALSSSPAAAAATFGKASGLLAAAQGPADEEAHDLDGDNPVDDIERSSLARIDEVAAPVVMDVTDDDADGETIDEVLGTDTDKESLADDPDGYKAAMAVFAQRARALEGPKADAKLKTVTKIVTDLIEQGHNPILFCRFIDTAQYVAGHLSAVPALKAAGVRVEDVTGRLTPDERDLRVKDLTAHDGPRILVATDCLSEGINLQAGFDAVIHYDLAWNPTRHEQREGRVDRYGQTAPEVRTVTYYGSNVPVDGVVLDVLIRRHERIKKATGVVVSVPQTSTAAQAALWEALILREGEERGEALALFSVEEVRDFEVQWETSAKEEARSRSLFSQGRLDPTAIESAVAAVRDSLGGPADARAFAIHALTRLGVPMVPVAHGDGGGFTTRVIDVPRPVQDQWPVAMNRKPILRFRENGSPLPGEALLTRTDPYVESLARYVLDAALDPNLPTANRPAHRASVVTTHAVMLRTVLLVVRYRIQLSVPGAKVTRSEVADHADFLAYRDTLSGDREWLSPEEIVALLAAEPSASTSADLADDQLGDALAELSILEPVLSQRGERAATLLTEQHAAVRAALGSRARGITATLLPPADVLGVYVYLPDRSTR